MWMYKYLFANDHGYLYMSSRKQKNYWISNFPLSNENICEIILWYI